jgi:hypothetical protein
MANTFFFEPSFLLGFVPYVASEPILLKTWDFLGGVREVHILINYKGLKKNRDVGEKFPNILY